MKCTLMERKWRNRWESQPEEFNHGSTVTTVMDHSHYETLTAKLFLSKPTENGLKMDSSKDSSPKT